ncbi:MAG: Hsp33 family molecular chaperone HslO [Nitrospirae bacterium]|jgi:molecular chaperone Hsp33|nr:Hsp33 family molecular chaperone HslO [Nitrospirota bacterium]
MDLLLKGMTKGEPLLVIGLVDTETVEKARIIHDTYPTVSAAFGRMISGAILLSSLLKEGQKVILQVIGDGPLKEVVAEADWLCRVRGYVKKPHIHLGLKDGKLDVGRAIGNGILNVIKDLGLREYYHGSVLLQTGEIATDLAYYFKVSEQIPAAVSLGVYVDTDNSVKASGGFMIHALPGVSEETIEYLEERLKGLRTVSSMILNGLGPKEIMEEAVGLPLDVIDRKEVFYYCPCNKDRVMDTIVALGKKDIEELVEKGEAVNVMCRFCKTGYAVSQEELLSILKAIDRQSEG